MPHHTPEPAPTEAAMPLPADRQQAIEHRFRHATRQGQLSPLLHLMLRHEQNRPPCQPSP